jgi:hypothetical protein
VHKQRAMQLPMRLLQQPKLSHAFSFRTFHS